MKKRTWLILVLLFFASDLATKDYVVKNFRMHETVEVIPGFFSLTYTTNPGIAFSLFADVDSEWKVILLTLVGLLALGYVAWLVWRNDPPTVSARLGLALIAGGILGNMSNRVFTGSVVDFLDFYLGSFTWPTFNLADTFICVGAGLVVLNLFRGGETDS
jgi:signal peptidase II